MLRLHGGSPAVRRWRQTFKKEEITPDTVLLMERTDFDYIGIVTLGERVSLRNGAKLVKEQDATQQAPDHDAKPRSLAPDFAAVNLSSGSNEIENQQNGVENRPQQQPTAQQTGVAHSQYSGGIQQQQPQQHNPQGSTATVAHMNADRSNPTPVLPAAPQDPFAQAVARAPLQYSQTSVQEMSDIFHEIQDRRRARTLERKTGAALDFSFEHMQLYNNHIRAEDGVLFDAEHPNVIMLKTIRYVQEQCTWANSTKKTHLMGMKAALKNTNHPGELHSLVDTLYKAECRRVHHVDTVTQGGDRALTPTDTLHIINSIMLQNDGGK